MNIQKYVFATIEIVGCATVALIWLALTNATFLYQNKLTPFIMWTLLPMATTVMLITLTRYWTKVSRTALFYLGLVLLLAGAVIAFLVPEYFSWAMGLHTYYWFKVSAYTLPAVCTEGAIFTLFISFVERGDMRQKTLREQILLSAGFVIYATFTVTANFMVLNGSMTIASHVLFSRVVSGGIALVALGIWCADLMKKNTQLLK